jgi:hypothetical protein
MWSVGCVDPTCSVGCAGTLWGGTHGSGEPDAGGM